MPRPVHDLSINRHYTVNFRTSVRFCLEARSPLLIKDLRHEAGSGPNSSRQARQHAAPLPPAANLQASAFPSRRVTTRGEVSPPSLSRRQKPPSSGSRSTRPSGMRSRSTGSSSTAAEAAGPGRVRPPLAGLHQAEQDLAQAQARQRHRLDRPHVLAPLPAGHVPLRRSGTCPCPHLRHGPAFRKPVLPGPLPPTGRGASRPRERARPSGRREWAGVSQGSRPRFRRRPSAAGRRGRPRPSGSAGRRGGARRPGARPGAA